MAEILFYVFASVAVGSAILMVFQKNPVGSLLFMVMTLACISGIFVLLEAHFLAAIQIMVYAGAIMVLFLFVIMLLNLGHDYHPDLRFGFWSVLSLAAIGAIGGILIRQFGAVEASPTYRLMAGGAAIDAMVADRGAVGAIAVPLFTEYVVPFEITGILLLVAIVGALVLAKRRV